MCTQLEVAEMRAKLGNAHSTHSLSTLALYHPCKAMSASRVQSLLRTSPFARTLASSAARCSNVPRFFFHSSSSFLQQDATATGNAQNATPQTPEQQQQQQPPNGQQPAENAAAKQLEDKVKTLEEQVKELRSQLTYSYAERFDDVICIALLPC